MTGLAGGQQRPNFQQYTSPPLTVQQIQQLQQLQAQQQHQLQMRASGGQQIRPGGMQQGTFTSPTPLHTADASWVQASFNTIADSLSPIYVYLDSL